jgi:lipoprotein-anchoring transpeptidase ErfK/SrfK
MSSGRHARKRLSGRGPIIVLVAFAVLAAMGAGSAYAAYSFDHAKQSRILPGIHVAGVDVSNMTRKQAMAVVKAKVRHRLDSKLDVRVGKRTWERTLSELGLHAKVGAAVDQALAVTNSYSWVSRVYHRVANRPVDREIKVPFQLNVGAVKAFVKEAADQTAVPAQDAGYELVNGSIVMTHAHPGRALAMGPSRQHLRKMVRLGSGGTLKLPLTKVEPKVTDANVGKAIVVNRSNNMLTLYNHFAVERTYPVATAMPGFETPPGAWAVINKVENPTWVNPCLGQPGCWAASEPAEIPPGPGNPLGTRALYLNAPGIRIHGTPSDSSIGTYASHGCIRMHIPDSEALYPLVPIGTPAFIIGSPPWGNTTNPGVAG